MEIYDPLAPIKIVLKGRDFERALVPEGQHTLQVIGAEFLPNKNKDNSNVHITSTLTRPTPTTKPDVVAQPGDRKFQTWDGVFATPNQEEKGVDPLARIADILCAVFNVDLKDCPDLDSDTLNQMVGREFIGIVKHEDDPQFGKQDRLVRYLPKKD